jgi:hypothetical protein
MGLKSNDHAIEIAQEDEPIFVLLARDRTAPARIRDWAQQVRAHYQALRKPISAHTEEKLRSALKTADDMQAWQAANFSKLPD